LVVWEGDLLVLVSATGPKGAIKLRVEPVNADCPGCGGGDA
jgi:hypothetical protein